MSRRLFASVAFLTWCGGAHAQPVLVSGRQVVFTVTDNQQAYRCASDTVVTGRSARLAQSFSCPNAAEGVSARGLSDVTLGGPLQVSSALDHNGAPNVGGAVGAFASSVDALRFHDVVPAYIEFDVHDEGVASVATDFSTSISGTFASFVLGTEVQPVIPIPPPNAACGTVFTGLTIRRLYDGAERVSNTWTDRCRMGAGFDLFRFTFGISSNTSRLLTSGSAVASFSSRIIGLRFLDANLTDITSRVTFASLGGAAYGNLPAQVVPEPVPAALLTGGLVALAFVGAWRRRRKSLL